MRTTLTMATVMACGLAVLSGCQEPLFPERYARNPYERYQTLRGQYRPSTETNEFGAEEPALRRRLQPLDSP